MNILQTHKILWVAFFIVLLSLLLAACGTVPDFEQTAVNPASTINQQTNNTQISTTNDEWDAATFYASTCASCHGAKGNGSAFAPALNQENIETAEQDWLVETISYGRPGTAMSAWSVEAGGPLNSDQIAAMVDFLRAGNWETAGDIAQQQPGFPMGNGGRGMMGGGMMGNHGNGMMGSMNNNQQP